MQFTLFNQISFACKLKWGNKDRQVNNEDCLLHCKKMNKNKEAQLSVGGKDSFVDEEKVIVGEGVKTRFEIS